MLFGFIGMSATSNGNDTTLLWGINIIASIIGTVLAALLAMVIGFNGNLLIGLAMYLGASVAAWLALAARGRHPPVRMAESE